jgi:hypothetical protein
MDERKFSISKVNPAVWLIVLGVGLGAVLLFNSSQQVPGEPSQPSAATPSPGQAQEPVKKRVLKADAKCPATIENVSDSATCDRAYAVNECGENCGPITSSECLACEKKYPEVAETADCGYSKGEAQGGPAKGKPRAELCRKAVECLRETNCAVDNHIICYCGDASAECFSGSAHGDCKQVLEAALETTNPAEIATRMGDATYGGAVALLRMASDRDRCKSVCFASPSAQVN